MRAAVLRGAGKPLEIEQIEVARPAAREVLIRTAATGICRTDLNFQTGDFFFPTPTVLGHEGAGIIQEVGSSDTDLAAGDHVIQSIVPSCNKCLPCLRGRWKG